jgi:fumarylpyruvate hydrolase
VREYAPFREELVMKMEYVISSWDIPSLPIVASNARFPVRRIFCVGRNYVEHQKEMGGDGREQPFFFTKSAHDLVALNAGQTGAVHYPPMTSNYHWETEMVAVIGTGGYKIPAAKANGHIWGYAVGLDMTRRDLQQVGKDKGRPWTFGKDFDQAAPVGAITPSSTIGHPTKGKLWLKVNGALRQNSDIDQMIWSVPEQIAFLSQYYTLEAGDLIMTGTPAGVGAAKAGDELLAGIEGLGELQVKVLAPKS